MTGAPAPSWRKETRARLIAARQTLTAEGRAQAAELVSGRLERVLATTDSRTLGLYWPINREINLIPWARALARREGLTLCLPVVVTPKAPLEYWRWTPGAAMKPGVWNIPAPAERDVLTPDLVLAPLVGFDRAKYRLGYGGGYFDRTLAALERRPVAVGVGYESGALETIFPQTHDIAMDAIVTEARAMVPTHWSGHDI